MTPTSLTQTSYPCHCTHWTQTMLAFFQSTVTSDSMGASVIAQHEHCMLLSRFRHCSVTWMVPEIWRGGTHEQRGKQMKDVLEAKRHQQYLVNADGYVRVAYGHQYRSRKQYEWICWVSRPKSFFCQKYLPFFKNSRKANKRIVLHVFSMKFHHY